MLLDLYDFGFEPRTLHLFLGLFLGAIFGVAAQISRFCLRRAVAGPTEDRRSAFGVWAAAFAVALLAVQTLAVSGYIELDGHRWITADLPVAALILGGLAFGAGMVLTRGCVSRLSVLAPSGNLRAVAVLVLFALAAHATMKGVLAPLRGWITQATLPSPIATLGDLPGGPLLWAIVIAVPLLFLVLRSGARPLHIALGALIGLVAASGWAATSVLLFDEFDPLPVQSVAFTLPWTDTLFWTIASTAVAPGFGVGFVGGVLIGAFGAAVVRREARIEGFESGRQMLRYGTGGVLMGVGGVLAGGCTVGAGLAGGATLSISALIALAAIIAGATAANAALEQRPLRETALA